MTDKAQVALELCRTKALAYIGTVDEDGQPQVTPVWVDVREGKPAFNTAVGRAKERNLATRSAGLAGDRRSRRTRTRYVEVQGAAALTEDGADQFIDDLAKKYLGRGLVSVPHAGRAAGDRAGRAGEVLRLSELGP